MFSIYYIIFVLIIFFHYFFFIILFFFPYNDTILYTFQNGISLLWTRIRKHMHNKGYRTLVHIIQFSKHCTYFNIIILWFPEVFTYIKNLFTLQIVLRKLYKTKTCFIIKKNLLLTVTYFQYYHSANFNKSGHGILLFSLVRFSLVGRIGTGGQLH